MIKRLLILGACALAIGASARYFFPPTPASADVTPNASNPTLIPTGRGRLRWETVWTQKTPHLKDVTLAPNGSSVVWVDDVGSIRRIDATTHHTLWQTDPYPGFNTVRVAPQGTVIAYSRLNPNVTTVRVLDAAVGQSKSVLLPVLGAVWSAAITPDGTQAVVGTGKSLLYCFPLRKDAVIPGAPINLPGIPETVEIASVATPANGNPIKETIALLGTWQDGGVCAWGLDRLPRWRYEEKEPDFTYKVTLSHDGSTAAAVASRGPRHESARLHVWDTQSGKLLFIEDLHGFAPSIALSANGQHIAVTYCRADDNDNGLVSSDEGNIEHKLLLFDRSGRRLFEEKGGVFFAPELVGLSADGTRLIVSDKQGTLWTLDSRGRTIARLTAPDHNGHLMRALTTGDGDYILLYRSDDTITLYHAVLT